MFNVGDIVRYSEKWCSPGERKYIHIVMEAYPPRNKTDKCIKIETQNTLLTFKPTEWVTPEMIEKI